MTDFSIIGAGLAGLLVTRQLIERGVSPVNLHVFARAAAPMASDAPGTLMHALPGMSLRPKPGAADAYEDSKRWLEGISQDHPDLVNTFDMLRPSFGHRRGKRYLKTYERGKAELPSSLHHERLDPPALDDAPGAVSDALAAVRYGPAFMLELGTWIKRERRALELAGVDFQDHQVTRIRQGDEQKWNIFAHEAYHTLPFVTDHIILALGPGLNQWFPALEIGVNGGELACAAPPVIDGDAVTLDHAISGGGHIAPRADGRWVFGATYLRPDERARDPTSREAFVRKDSTARRALVELLEHLMPSLRSCDDVEVWRGRRAVYLPDRNPVVGHVPEQPRLSLIGALGSKGMLWGPHLARRLVDLIFDGAPIPDVASVSRVDPTHWSSPVIG